MEHPVDKAFHDFIDSLGGDDIEESVKLLENLKQFLMQDIWPEVDSTWDEREGRRCYGKYIDK
jgi:hypothetical protein